MIQAFQVFTYFWQTDKEFNDYAFYIENAILFLYKSGICNWMKIRI